MIAEAISTVEAVIWGAVISFGILAAGAAYLTVALGYWTAVLALRATRAITNHRTRKENQP